MPPPTSGLRALVSALIRRHPWLPAAATLASGAAFALALSRHPNLPEALAAAVLLLTSFVWGYSVRALKFGDWAPLTHLKRRQYAEVWNALAASPDEAKAATCGAHQERVLRRTAEPVHRNLDELVGIRPQDDILEIGCGVGRIGLDLASRCRSWTGADISANMLAVAAERLAGFSNVRLVQLQGVALREIADNSFDLLYSANVFPHLDEMDRWRYVQDAFRVLRPGGRIFVDNVDLESDAGWQSFERGARQAQDLERPPYYATFATAGEYTAYATRAGFEQVRCHQRPPLLILTATKPVS